MGEKKEIEENQEPSSPAWMTTFSDMMTLLLTFFVLLLSFSNMDEIKFAMAAKSLRGALGVLNASPSPRPVNSTSPQPEDILERKELYESVLSLEKKAKELGIENEMNIDFNENGILIQLGDRVLFDLGKSELKPEAYPILNLVAKIIREKAENVLVSGHTDNVPINSPRFPSNWELSTSRAVNVVRYMIGEAGVPAEMLGATGYSEFRPVVPNITPENRGRNRRVEFLVTWK